MQEMVSIATPSREPVQQADGSTQSCGLVLELSPDWLILRASENAHGFLGEYPARLIGEPLASFTLAQPLHDLRNSLSRQRSSNGIARAYRTRLTAEPRHFESRSSRSTAGCSSRGCRAAMTDFGDCLGAVSRLVDGMAGDTRAASSKMRRRRMRALTGFDRVTVSFSARRRASGRKCAEQVCLAGKFASLPAIVADAMTSQSASFPRRRAKALSGQALLRALVRARSVTSCRRSAFVRPVGSASPPGPRDGTRTL